MNKDDALVAMSSNKKKIHTKVKTYTGNLSEVVN